MSEINSLAQEIKALAEEVKNTKRTTYKETSSIEENTEAINQLSKDLIVTRDLIQNILQKQLEDAGQQFKEIIDERQNKAELQKKIESWQDAAIDFFESLERILAVKETQSDISLVHKILQDFDKSVNKLGLQRIIPCCGEEVDKELHQVNKEKNYEESSDVQPETVLKCTKWGYKIWGQLYKSKRAEVILAKAPENEAIISDTCPEAQQNIDKINDEQVIHKSQSNQDSQNSNNTND